MIDGAARRRNEFSERGGDVQPTWFRAPSGDDPGTLNLCFDAVDLQVVRGRAESVAVRKGEAVLHHARLLEDVAALGGALRGLGVGPGTPVAGLLDDPLDALLLELACLRLGAPYVELPDDPGPLLAEQRPSVVASSRRLDLPQHAPDVWLLRDVVPRDEVREVDWELAVRAGRTDPAPCVDQRGDAVALVVGGDAVVAADVLGHPSPAARRVATLASGDVLDLAGVDP